MGFRPWLCAKVILVRYRKGFFGISVDTSEKDTKYPSRKKGKEMKSFIAKPHEVERNGMSSTLRARLSEDWHLKRRLFSEVRKNLSTHHTLTAEIM